MPKPQPRPNSKTTLDSSAKKPTFPAKKRHVPSQAAVGSHPLNDRSVQRRARKKAQTRRKNWTVGGVFAVLSLMIGSAAFGAYSGYKGPYWRYQDMKTNVAEKNETLQILQKQLAQKQKQLALLTSPTGKDQVLVEQGFVREGERILLFPKEKTP